MPRNEAIPLNDAGLFLQKRAIEVLTDIQAKGEKVELHYVKRNNDVSSSTGTIAFFSGKPGYTTGAVTLDTPEKGRPTTINLHRITKYRRVR